MGTRAASRKRSARLKKGFPLSTGATPAKPPQTKRATTSTVKRKASTADAAAIKDRQEQDAESGANVRRPKEKKAK